MKIENKTLNIAGKKTQLTILGEGPPLLYLHSAGGETEPIAFHHKLAEKYTVYLPAHPGFALSEGLDHIDDIHDLAWHYVDLLGELNLENVPVVSYSLGAWTAAEVKLIRPNLIGPMVMIAAAGLHVDGSPMEELFIDSFDKLRELLFFDPSSKQAIDYFPADTNDPRILMWLRAREATARVGWNPYLHDPKLAGHLHRLDSPVQVIWGRHDKLIPLAHGEYYTQHLPNAKLTVLEQCGHMVPYEKTEEAAAIALDFLGSIQQHWARSNPKASLRNRAMTKNDIIIPAVFGLILVVIYLASLDWITPPSVTVKFYGKPVANIPVMLLNTSYEPISTDATGTVRLPNAGDERAGFLIRLPDGTGSSIHFPRYGNRSIDFRGPKVITHSEVSYFGVFTTTEEGTTYSYTDDQWNAIIDKQMTIEEVERQIDRQVEQRMHPAT